MFQLRVQLGRTITGLQKSSPRNCRVRLICFNNNNKTVPRSNKAMINQHKTPQNPMIRYHLILSEFNTTEKSRPFSRNFIVLSTINTCIGFYNDRKVGKTKETVEHQHRVWPLNEVQIQAVATRDIVQSYSNAMKNK